ncbi:MAG TPA: acetate/propionate family kinase [Casimicrobiaceae bacterium]|nr:acetate/propionate family kinase [Casimicrobiaceae bacterium]
MRAAILVLNAGSSSVKFCLYDGAHDAIVLRGQVDAIGGAPRVIVRDGGGSSVADERADGATDHAAAVAHLLDVVVRHARGHALVAAGHRVVHGGSTYAAPVRLTRAVIDDLAALIPLAPLHQPHNVAAIEALARRLPDLPQVACFDTAFHRTQPEIAQVFALPAAVTARGIRRYGFHGLSYEYVAGALPAIDARAARGRTIVAHLGNGASMCALEAGRSIATTMGFTPLDGLVMGTRPGSLDPGVVLYLMSALGYDRAGVERLLYHESGLLGVSGIASDMRTLLASADPRAAAAIDLFCYRAARELGSLAAALRGLDALVFTGGIGEHAAAVRAGIVRGAEWLGAQLDEDANARHAPRISRADSQVTVHVVPTDEERMILRHTRALLAA